MKPTLKWPTQKLGMRVCILPHRAVLEFLLLCSLCSDTLSGLSMSTEGGVSALVMLTTSVRP